MLGRLKSPISYIFPQSFIGYSNRRSSCGTVGVYHTVSFLPTIRDIVKLRYVSRKLRIVSQASSLWNEFLWPFYHRREETDSVISVLKDCGEYVRRLVFPVNIKASALFKMIGYCNQVTQLYLIAGTKLY